MEVFITKANAERLIAQMDLSQVELQAFEDGFEFKWFNKLELKKLKAYSMLFLEPSTFFEQYKIIPARDNSNFVFKGTAPAFHSNFECERLNSDFRNIKIPSQLKQEDEKKEFAQWCNENREFFEKYPDQFLYRLNKKFNITSNPFVHYDNSGVQTFNNYSLPQLENAIQKLIVKADIFITSSTKNEEVIESFGLSSYLYKIPQKLYVSQLKSKLNRENVVEILRIFECTYKQPLIELFKNYYRMQNNRELSFKADALTELGFNPCSECCMSIKSLIFAA